MNFLTSQTSSGGGSGLNIYISAIDNTDFVASNGKFKAIVTHGLNTNNLMAQIDNGDMVDVVSYKYLNDNEIEVYYGKAEDVKVKVLGLQKVETDSLSIVGMGVLGKIILGKNN